MIQSLILLLLLSVSLSSSKELLWNGNFEEFDQNWQFTCYPNPICDENLCHETFGSGYYLKAQKPCQLVQCTQSGGKLTFQASSSHLDITFGDQPFVGVLISDNRYTGNVSCNDGYCCLKINFTNTTVYLDNISLDDGKIDPTIYVIILFPAAGLLCVIILLIIHYYKTQRVKMVRFDDVDT